MKRVLIVDGYNVINVRKPVRESRGLEDARRALTDKLHDYAGWSGQRIILVYDAWLSDRMQRSVEERGPLQVVFTIRAEEATVIAVPANPPAIAPKNPPIASPMVCMNSLPSFMSHLAPGI